MPYRDATDANRLVAVTPSPTDALLAVDEVTAEVQLAAGRSRARHAVDGGSAVANSFADTVSNTDDANPIRSSVQEVRCAPR